MGRTISQETYLKETRREKTIEGLDRAFQKLGYRYLGMQPNIMNKPWLCEGKRPYKPIRALGIRQAQAMLKKMGAKGNRG